MKIYKNLLLLLFSIHFSTAAQTDTVERTNYTLLWEITSSWQDQPSYLFGTMHVENKEAFRFSDSVLIVFDKVDAVALELNLDTVIQTIFGDAISDRYNETAYEMESFEESDFDIDFEKLKEKFTKKGINPRRIKNKKTLDYLFLEDEDNTNMPTFLDGYLFQRAKALNKVVYGLEEFEQQMTMMEGAFTTENDQYFHPDSFLSQLDLEEKAFDFLLKTYEEGDLTKIEKLPHFEKDFFEAEWMIKRNNIMIASMDTLMKTGSIFTAVGVGHLPGEHGLIHLLQEAGYSVRPVSASFTGLADSILNLDLDYVWHTATDSAAGFQLKVPYDPFGVTDGIPGLDMQVSYDLISGLNCYYYAVPLAIAGIEDNSMDIMQTLVDRLKKSGANSVDNIKEIHYEKVKGFEFELSKSFFFKARVRVFTLNKHLYLFMVGITDEILFSEDAEAFFNSIKFFKPEINEAEKIEDWDEYVYEEAAYTIKFPSKPTYSLHDFPNPLNEEGEPYKLHMYLSTNQAKQQVYLLRWNDTPNGFVFNQDSLIFQETFSSVYGEDYVFDPTIENLYLINGVSGYEPQETAMVDGWSLRMRLFLRGNRQYLLIGQSLKGKEFSEEMEHFFNSFEPLPFLPPALSPQKIEELTVLLPDIPIKEEQETNGYYWLNDFNYTSYTTVDKNSATSYVIGITDYDEYHRIYTIDSFYREIMDNNLEYTQSVEEIIIAEHKDGSKFAHGTYLDANTVNKTSFYYKYQNNKLYELTLYPALEDHSLFEKIMDSIDIEDLAIDFDPYASKAAALLLNLQSADSTTYTNAKDALDYYSFDSTELILLVNALNLKYEDSSEYYYSIPYLLLDAIANFKDTVSLPSLKEFYLKTDEPYLANKALNIYVDIIDDPIRSIALIEQYPTEKLTYYNVQQLLDQLAENGVFNENYLRFAKLCNDAGSKSSFTSYIQNNKDTIGWTYDNKEAFLNILDEWFLTALDSFTIIEADTARYDYYDHQSLLLSIIEHYKHSGKNYDAKVNLINTHQYPDFLSDVSLYKISRGEKIGKSTIQLILQDGYNAYYFVKELIQTNRTDLLPKKVMEHKYLAQLALGEYMSYDDDIPDKFKYLETVVIDTEQGPQTFYFYLMSYEYYDSEVLGIAGGLLDSSGRLNLDDVYSDYYYLDDSEDKSELQDAKRLLIDYIKSYYKADDELMVE